MSFFPEIPAFKVNVDSLESTFSSPVSAVRLYRRLAAERRTARLTEKRNDTRQTDEN